MNVEPGDSRFRLPDFIIGGAQKAATTSLHYLLAQHPRVFIPDGELFFFALDDAVETEIGDTAADRYRWEEHFETYLRWYATRFVGARADQLVGEDSTTYLSCAAAPQRIAALLPDVKLIFILRSPVRRAHSHYWHRVASGRATHSFEASLRRDGQILIRRGLYSAGLARYLALFPRQQIKVVLFEHFAANPQGVVDELTSFLGLSDRLNVSALEARQNRARIPRHVSLQLAYNRLRRRSAEAATLGKPPYTLVRPRPAPSVATRILDRAHRILNPVASAVYPPLSPETELRLWNEFKADARALGDLIGMDVTRYWEPVAGGSRRP